MECPDCHSNISADSRFCSQCGSALADDKQHTDAVVSKVMSQADRAVSRTKSDIEAEAKAQRVAAFFNFQKDATAWAKYQLYAFSFVFAMILGISGFFGYDTVDDFRELADSARDHINGKIANIDEKAEKIAAIAAKIDKIKTEDIDKNITQLHSSLAEAKRLTRQASELISIVKNLENARYQLVIHITDTSDSRRNESLAWMTEKLKDRGFGVGPYSFKKISSDKCEIVYYHPATRHVAEKLQKNVLSKRFPGIEVKGVFSDVNRDPYLLYIKIPAKHVPGSHC